MLGSCRSTVPQTARLALSGIATRSTALTAAHQTTAKQALSPRRCPLVFSAPFSASRCKMTSISTLASQDCEPCRKSTPALAADDVSSLLQQLDSSAWKLETFVGSGELKVLQRSFAFKNFKQAIKFAQSVGDMAEEMKHHPEMLVGWGHVEVAWWSHAIGGLHRNDFVCAAKTNEIAKNAEGLKA